MVELVMLAYVAIGVALLGAVVLPRVLSYQPVSMPMVYVGAGLLLFSLPVEGVVPDPNRQSVLVERMTELVVIIALMGAGLKLDRPFGLRAWSSTWRLLGITMPLTIGLAVLLGHYVLGLRPATAVLLGAVVAPTDPVLASDVEAGPPLSSIEEDTEPERQVGVVRFSLTSEAGLNDGLAFPFTNLAIVLAGAETLSATAWAVDWVLYHVLYKIVVGVIAGYIAGRILARIIFRSVSGTKISKAIAGAEALAATLVTYGLTELVNGYGFIAVFVAALVLRTFEWEHEYYRTLHDFAVLIEHLLMGAVLLLFGGMIANGLLAPLSPTGAVLGLLLILFVRPVSGMIGLIGFDTTWIERVIIAGFGVRGIGSFYYLSHALNEASFEEFELIVARDELWALVGFVVVVSIVLHGLLASPVMQKLEAMRRDEDAKPEGPTTSTQPRHHPAGDPAETGAESDAEDEEEETNDEEDGEEDRSNRQPGANEDDHT